MTKISHQSINNVFLIIINTQNMKNKNYCTEFNDTQYLTAVSSESLPAATVYSASTADGHPSIRRPTSELFQASVC